MNVFLAASGVSQAFPVMAGIAARGRLNAGRRWMVAWGVYSVLGLSAQYWSSHYGHNLWLSYVLNPIDGSLSLLALACWQERPLLRRAIRWAVPAAIIVQLVLILVFEKRTEFSIAAAPIFGILCFVAAMLTLVLRAQTTTEPLVRQDWFWVAGGLAIYFTAYTIISPLANTFARTDQYALLLLYNTFAVVNVVAYALVAVGVACPAERAVAVPP